MRFVYYALCSAAMLGFILLVKLFVNAVSFEFAFGFYLGMMFMAALMLVAQRCEAAEKDDPY